MFRNIGFGAAAVLAVGALAIGCSDDGDTIIGGGTLTTDNFPGSQIQDSNVGDDGRAFTNQGQSQNNDDFEIFWNVTDGNAIAMFQLESTASASSDVNLLYVARFDSNRWSPPVQIRGRDLTATPNVFEDPHFEANGYKVLWINTAGDPTPEVAARTGDAILIFTRRDLGPAAAVTTSEDQNTRLWMTYFDRSAADAPAAGGWVRGFQTNAITVDDEVIFTGSGNDPSVDTFGFVSDSHEGTHGYGDGIDEVRSGQPTTFVSLVYRKQDTTTNGQRFLTKNILGDAVDNTLENLLGSEDELVAGIGLVTSESAGDEFFTHNELMLWNATKDSGFDNDQILTATTFDSDGQVDSALVGNTINTINDQQDSVEVEGFYGPDQGLAAWYIIYTETGFRTDNGPSTGDRDPDADLFVAQINADEALSVQSEAIENFVDTIQVTSLPTQGGSNTGVDNVESRLNRSAEFITILFNEVNTNTDFDSNGDTVNTNQLLYVAAVQTRRASTFGDTDVRDLADSVAGPTLVPATAATGVNSGTGLAGDVTEFEFQQDLADSEGLPQCSFQSNAYRVNFIYTQIPDAFTVAASDLENLLVNGIEFTPGVLVDDSPDFDLVDSAQEIVDTRDTGYGDEFEAVAVDAGDQTRDATTGAPALESGRVLVFYVLNGNNPTSDPSEPNTSAFGEPRLFVYDQGVTALVSTDGPREFDLADDGLISVETVPVNEDFVNTPHHAGTTLHVFWTEIVNDGPAQRIMTRSYDKGALNDGATTNDALETRFTPNLTGVATGADPVQIDLITDGPIGDLAFQGFSDFIETAVDGTTVGIYFAEDEHLYYSDTAGDATGWDTEAGLPSPQLIDNDSPTGTRVVGWFLATPPECNDLRKSMVIFSRDDQSQFNSTSTTAIRVYVRVHN